MLHIRLFALGRLKEHYLTAGITEYAKRLQPLCRLQIIELSDEKLPQIMSLAEIEQIKTREGQQLLRLLNEQEYLIALDLHGESLSSEQFAAHLDKLALNAKNDIAFAIGASLGLSREVLARANLRLSFGALTYPHQLMRILLLEQLYRAFKINRNEPYHK